MTKRTRGHKLLPLTDEYKKKRKERNERRDRAGKIAEKQRRKKMPDGSAA